MSKPKLIVLDFDGVIIESADIKTNAFKKLFSSHVQHKTEIYDYLEHQSGVSRYEKFVYIYKNILKLHLDEENAAQLDKEFSALVLAEILKCPFVNGVQEFLESQYKKTRLFLASATPQKELEYIVNARGIARYFSGIYGAPLKKSIAMAKIMGEYGIDRSMVLFIGDSMADYTEAMAAGVLFIGRLVSNSKAGNSRNIFPKSVRTIGDFSELGALLEAMG